MRVFTCHCKWRFVVGKKNVYGPVFITSRFVDATYANMMSVERFKDAYADCYTNWLKEVSVG